MSGVIDGGPDRAFADVVERGGAFICMIPECERDLAIRAPEAGVGDAAIRPARMSGKLPGEGQAYCSPAARSKFRARPSSAHDILLVMRAALRVLLCLSLCGSLAVAALPRQPLVPEIQKTDCCAKMKAEAAAHDCDHHPAPKPDPEKQCCAACAFGLAGILAGSTPFVYPAAGDENFADYLLSERTRAQRPPVPPPRA